MSDEAAPPVGGRDAFVRSASFVLLGIVGVSIAARISVPLPGTPVPQSLQTVAVLLTGVGLGPALGGVALGLYVLLGAAGVPVFAEGASGLDHLTGPTAGYLAGFIAAAVLLGWWRRSGRCESLWLAFVGMVLGHGVILLLGWTWLAVLAGPADAFRQGVAPFVAGGVVKAAAAALVVVVMMRSLERRGPR